MRCQYATPAHHRAESRAKQRHGDVVLVLAGPCLGTVHVQACEPGRKSDSTISMSKWS